MDDQRRQRQESSSGTGPSRVTGSLTKVRLVVSTAAVAVITSAAALCPAVALATGPLDPLVIGALRSESYLFVDGQPRFDVVDVVQPQSGWYVSHIRLRDVDAGTATVILRQDQPPGGPMTVIEGPGTAFQRGSFPPAVERLVTVYN